MSTIALSLPLSLVAESEESAVGLTEPEPEDRVEGSLELEPELVEGSLELDDREERSPELEERDDLAPPPGPLPTATRVPGAVTSTWRLERRAVTAACSPGSLAIKLRMTLGLRPPGAPGFINSGSWLGSVIGVFGTVDLKSPE